MPIKSVELSGHACFSGHTVIQPLSSGLNVIAGDDSTGKTSILTALMCATTPEGDYPTNFYENCSMKAAHEVSVKIVFDKKIASDILQQDVESAVLEMKASGGCRETQFNNTVISRMPSKGQDLLNSYIWLLPQGMIEWLLERHDSNLFDIWDEYCECKYTSGVLRNLRSLEDIVKDSQEELSRVKNYRKIMKVPTSEKLIFEPSAGHEKGVASFLADLNSRRNELEQCCVDASIFMKEVNAAEACVDILQNTLSSDIEAAAVIKAKKTVLKSKEKERVYPPDCSEPSRAYLVANILSLDQEIKSVDIRIDQLQEELDMNTLQCLPDAELTKECKFWMDKDFSLSNEGESVDTDCATLQRELKDLLKEVETLDITRPKEPKLDQDFPSNVGKDYCSVQWGNIVPTAIGLTSDINEYCKYLKQLESLNTKITEKKAKIQTENEYLVKKKIAADGFRKQHAIIQKIQGNLKKCHRTDFGTFRKLSIVAAVKAQKEMTLAVVKKDDLEVRKLKLEDQLWYLDVSEEENNLSNIVQNRIATLRRFVVFLHRAQDCVDIAKACAEHVKIGKATLNELEAGLGNLESMCPRVTYNVAEREKLTSSIATLKANITTTRKTIASYITEIRHERSGALQKIAIQFSEVFGSLVTGGEGYMEVGQVAVENGSVTAEVQVQVKFTPGPETKSVEECTPTEKRIVFLAMILATQCRTQLCLLDEADVGLDPPYRDALWKWVRCQIDKGTQFIVTANTKNLENIGVRSTDGLFTVTVVDGKRVVCRVDQNEDGASLGMTE